MENTDLGKITAKYAIKFVLWTILFFVIGLIVAFITGGNAMMNADGSDTEELLGAINGFIYGLVVVDIITALIATKLSVKGVAKNFKITEENRAAILKRMMIVMIVVAVIVLIFHIVVVNSLKSYILEEVGGSYDSFGELIKEAEEELDDGIYGIFGKDEAEEAIDALKSMNFASNVYSISGLAYAIMIPVANVFLKKKIEA